ncbi:hypothetical protein [Cellulomonas hominis]|uniref:hypothetical protein n=1 Tax=Cellulomonas hominis TaxID=156981 RepID=UPI001B9CE3F5|nr:hypothetical protein [Cellulomonas hominis]VTR76053.1 hypothetical protein CHMI_00809 [Cellulomonas hominis]
MKARTGLVVLAAGVVLFAATVDRSAWVLLSLALTWGGAVVVVDAITGAATNGGRR